MPGFRASTRVLAAQAVDAAPPAAAGGHGSRQPKRKAGGPWLAVLIAVLGVLALVAACFAAPAVAHIQVTPTVAAPDDAVLFTVLVPNERDVATREVVLKIPPGVLPFSFEATPGWRRQLVEGADGAVDRVRWTGRLPRGAFARFSLLASTPPKPGPIAWKALQRYADGQVVRWIGGPASETPAAVTTISAAAAKQNAGGERGAAPSGAPDHRADSEDGDGSGIALVLASLALALAAAALVLRLLDRRRRTR